MLAGGDSGASCMIVSLDRDDHIKFLSRIIEPLDCGQQLVDHLRLAIERGDDTVDGQFFVGRGEARIPVEANPPMPTSE